MSDEKTRSLKQDVQMIKRACAIIHQMLPGYISASLANATFTSFIPYIAIYMSALIIDELVGGRNLKTLILYVAIAAGGTLILDIFNKIIERKVKIQEAMFGTKFDNYLNDIKLSMDFSKLEDPKCSELREKIFQNMFAVNGGLAQVVKQITSIYANLLTAILAIIVSCEAICTVPRSGQGVTGAINSGWFSVLLVLVIIICIAFTVKNSKTFSIKSFKLFQYGAKYNGYLVYYIYNYLRDDKAGKDVRIFDQRELLLNEMTDKGILPWWNSMGGNYALLQKYLGINVAISPLIGGFIYVFIGLKALTGTISLGSVTKSYAAINQLVSAVSNLFSSFSQIRTNNNYLGLIYQFIDMPAEEQTGEVIPAAKDGRWVIEFHNVSFRYPSCKNFVLKNLSMKISSDSRTAVVGMNGSGKTTMIKLLCRLYTPDSGHITLNGRDINSYEYDAYLKLFSVVFQDLRLLAFTVGQNVAASVAYDEQKVWNALESAGISDRVEEFPLKLKQPLYKYFEENGIDVSGGEEQKIAIARAVYKDAPFVVLDEPTASLDPLAEYEIYSKFNKIIGEKAAVFISHRLSSCRFCDTIAVFHNGELIQQGTHDELLRNEDGKYYELWNAQAQYYA